MTSYVPSLIVTTICCLAVVGCGRGSGNEPVIVEAGGIVTLDGNPVEQASVTFIPQKGQLALGVTNSKGEFKLSSGTRPGCAVGPAKVVVSDAQSVIDPAANAKKVVTPADLVERSQSQPQQETEKKSRIPANYGDPTQSGLLFNVDKDKSKNDFKVELKE